MDILEDEMSYDLFTRWSSAALQDYCRERGFPTTGTLSDLAAMAYTAYRTKAPVQMSQVDQIKLAKLQYQDKLKLPSGQSIPDPLSIDHGWEGEATGLYKWPNITYADIVSYLNTRSGLDAQTTLNKYKEGKAFSFFSSQFVKEVMINCISDSIVLLKTCVTHSTKMNEPPHKTWACTSYPEGDILRAYCTCTAG